MKTITLAFNQDQVEEIMEASATFKKIVLAKLFEATSKFASVILKGSNGEKLPTPHEFCLKVANMSLGGYKIGAIKWVREQFPSDAPVGSYGLRLSKVGLKDAKDFVEALAAIEERSKIS